MTTNIKPVAWLRAKRLLDRRTTMSDDPFLPLPKPDCPNIWGGCYSRGGVLAMLAAERERCATIVRSADRYGCACSDRDALADLLMGQCR